MWCRVCPTCPLKHCLFDLIRVPPRIKLWSERNWVRLFLNHGIFWALDSWVDAHTEDVLMVLCQSARADNIPPWAGSTWVDWDRANNARSSCLNGNPTSLVEMIRKDVFVVGESDDELYNQFPVASDDSTVCAIVCMFPQDTVVDFVHANNIFRDDSLAGGVVHDPIKVLLPEIIRSLLLKYRRGYHLP